MQCRSDATIPDVVASLRYKPGFAFKMGGPDTRYVCAFATTPDSNNPSVSRCTQHMFELPDADLRGRDAVRWLADKLHHDVEWHEFGEFFTVSGHRVFMPNHQQEGDPYQRVERWENTPWA